MDDLNKAGSPGPLAALDTWLEEYHFRLRITEQGNVISVGDGITWIQGLPSAKLEELLVFEEGSLGVVFHLTQELLGAILLLDTDALTSGTGVHLTGQQLSIPVGDSLLGRVIDPLGTPLDGMESPECSERRNLEHPSPPMVTRDFVHAPLYTGIKIIDTMIPMGRGQRQLIIGDEGLGKSAIAVDTIINQKGQGVYCVYVLIGQKRSTVLRTLDTLCQYGALDYTTVVVGEANALPGLQYLAPFAGCTLAEAWMAQGKDTLVIYDDLSTHARIYRELSLLLRRPPGREAYPGDIFHLHARLLERATCLTPRYGGGSMAAMPIVETQQGEIAAYIPTNLISITDGQIYLDADLFASGFRPAIDVAKSVSRIGGKAQHFRIREEAGRMKLDYLQFLELEIFTRFGAHLEPSMQAKIRHGRVLRKLLTQDRLSPLSIECQLAWLIAFNEGRFDPFELEAIPRQLNRLVEHIQNSSFTLDRDRNEWLQALETWLSVIPEDKE